MELSDKDVERILQLVDQSGYDEVRVEYGDLKIHVRRGGASGDAAPAMNAGPPIAKAETPAAPPAPQVISRAAPAPAPTQIPEGLIAVRAPMLGTFYRSPSPGAPPFVEEGAIVDKDETIGLIEVMKLFNSLRSGTTGRIARIVAENGALVEFNEVLFLLEPDSNA